MSARILTLDMRDDVRNGREPFSKVLAAAENLKSTAILLITPFEPVPLYRLMARQGFSHESKPTESGDWEVLFLRGAACDSFANPQSA
jgi:hypothetical protein